LETGLQLLGCLIDVKLIFALKDEAKPVFALKDEAKPIFALKDEAKPFDTCFITFRVFNRC
jgi:hypothetical protein